MIAKLKNSIYKITELAGVEVRFQQDGSITWSLVHLKKEKDVINVVATKEPCQTPEECLAGLSKDVPLFLSFAGRGIICKKAPMTDAGLDGVLAVMVPNANLEEFAYDVHEVGGQCIVALIRKAKLEPIIAQLGALKYQVIGVSLEFISLLRFESLLGIPASDKVVGGYLLKYSNGAIGEFSPTTDPAEALKVDNITIEARQLLPYTAAFVQMLLPQQTYASNIVALKDDHAEFLEKKLFRISLMGTLGAILTILICNALMFTNQFGKNEALKQESYKFQGKTDDIKKEELVILEKENFLKQNGWLHKSRLSFLSDKLAATVPNSINLQDFNINPIKIDNTASVKKSFFTDKKFNLRGRCYKSSDLSNWIQILKNLNWISDVQMVDYVFDHSNNSAVFNLEITYNIE